MEEDEMKEYMSDLDIQAAFALVNAYNMLADEASNGKDIDVANEYLKLFREFSTNFPRYVFDIAHVPKESYEYLLKYVTNLSQYLRAGRNTLELNGIQLQTDDSDIFSFYNILTKESRFIDNLTDIFIDYGSTTMNKELIGALLSTPLNMYVLCPFCCNIT